ncbi:MAG TPA: polymer-forming cytoskeletal protein, partial [candidate division Zixibacteria bacterium]|nr:polymer-forming cytoskeletal protein [candidate division Zixibacteria bacterium]
MIALVKQIHRLAVTGFLIFGISFSSFAQSNDSPENYAPRDTIFDEIVLTEEGVVAIDTAGYEWYYDFEYSVFVAGTPPLPEDGLGIFPDPGFEYTGVPIEERATIHKKVKHFESGSVTVRADEYVEGDITALGMVTIKGWVQGSVVSIRDRVLVTESGQVDGSIEAPKIIVKDGGMVYGEMIESEIPLELGDFTAGFSHEFLMVMVIITFSLMFLGFILLALMPRQLTNMQTCIAQYRGRSFVLGFLLLLVMPAIVVLLAITIIGTVLVPLLPLVYIWAILLGIVATGRGLVTPLYHKFISQKASPIFLGILGIIVLMTPWIITGALMGNEEGPAFGFGVFFLVISILIFLFPIFAGIGASFLTRFGFRTYSSVA